MKCIQPTLFAFASIIACLSQLPVEAQDNPDALQKVYAPMSLEDARSQTLTWVAEQGDEAKSKFETIAPDWAAANESTGPEELLSLVIPIHGGLR